VCRTFAFFIYLSKASGISYSPDMLNSITELKINGFRIKTNIDCNHVVYSISPFLMLKKSGLHFSLHKQNEKRKNFFIPLAHRYAEENKS
jgi:hypothetical protein